MRHLRNWHGRHRRHGRIPDTEKGRLWSDLSMVFKTWALSVKHPLNSFAACPATSLSCHCLLEFLSWYLSLSANISGVIRWSGPSPLIYAIPEQRYTFPARRYPNRRVFSPNSLVLFRCPLQLRWCLHDQRGISESNFPFPYISLLRINPTTTSPLDKTRPI